MKKNVRIIFIIVLVVILTITVAGCNKAEYDTYKALDETSEAGEVAIQYVKDIIEGEWDKVLENSTGEQLTIYEQLIPVLEKAKQENELKAIEIVDKTLDEENDLIYIDIHFIRTAKFSNGSITEEGSASLSMKKVDGRWKVFEMDVVTDSVQK